MTGLEKMMNQILEEANASANSKRAEAAAEADRIKAAAEAEAEDGMEDDADGETAFTVAEAVVNDVVKDGDERAPAPEEVAYV